MPNPARLTTRSRAGRVEEALRVTAQRRQNDGGTQLDPSFFGR